MKPSDYPLTSPILRVAAFAFATFFLAESQMSAATAAWDGDGPGDLWSTSTNWGVDQPAGNNVAFAVADTVGLGTINNIVQTSISISSLSYTQNGVNAWHNTEIQLGATLTVSGTANVLNVGASGDGTSTRASISGAGTLAVNQSGGTFRVGSPAGRNSAMLNMSGLSHFTANLGSTGTFLIGSTGTADTNPVNSTVNLAVNSTITANAINLGEGSNIYGHHLLELGSGINQLNANVINVGANDWASNARADATLKFAASDSTGTVKIRAANGTGAAVLNLGNGDTQTGSQGNLVNVVDLNGHSADLLLSSLTLAKRSSSAATSRGTTSTFSYDTGTLSVSGVVELAYKNNNSLAADARDQTQATLNLGNVGKISTSTLGSIVMSTNAQPSTVDFTGTLATINVKGGTHTVAGNITMSSTFGSQPGVVATSVINLTGGTFTVQGNIAEGTGTGTKNSTITLNGGTFDMDGGSITVDTFNIQSGTLQNLGQFNSGATLTKTTGGTVTLDGTNTYTGNTTVSGGNLVVTGSIASAGTYSVASGTKLQVGNNTATGSLGSGTIANAGTVELNRNNALSFGNAISGAGSVVQNGSGVTTFSATHSYTGSTQVNVGTLLVNGSIASSSGVSVAAGATLGGSGNVSALSGAGTIAPGNSPGILTAPSVEGSGGLDFAFEITALAPDYANAAASDNDVLRLTSGTPFVASLGSGNTVTVDFSTLSLAVGQTYFGGFYADSGDFLSSISGADFVFTGANGFIIAVSTAQQNADFGVGGSATGWVTQFDVLAIPEPSTTLLLTGGLMALVLFRRRRSR